MLAVYVLAVCMFAVHVHAVQLMDTLCNTWTTWGNRGWVCRDAMQAYSSTFAVGMPPDQEPVAVDFCSKL